MLTIFFEFFEALFITKNFGLKNALLLRKSEVGGQTVWKISLKKIRNCQLGFEKLRKLPGGKLWKIKNGFF